jgi:endonuclease III-like uncharacterized protein
MYSKAKEQKMKIIVGKWINGQQTDAWTWEELHNQLKGMQPETIDCCFLYLLRLSGSLHTVCPH